MERIIKTLTLHRVAIYFCATHAGFNASRFNVEAMEFSLISNTVLPVVLSSSPSENCRFTFNISAHSLVFVFRPSALRWGMS